MIRYRTAPKVSVDLVKTNTINFILRSRYLHSKDKTKRKVTFKPMVRLSMIVKTRSNLFALLSSLPLNLNVGTTNFLDPY